MDSVIALDHFNVNQITPKEIRKNLQVLAIGEDH